MKNSTHHHINAFSNHTPKTSNQTDSNATNIPNNEDKIREIEFQKMCAEDERSQMMNELYYSHVTTKYIDETSCEDGMKSFQATLSFLKRNK